MKRNYGFTLSEVLLVMLIIGIIAALAIPPIFNGITADRMKANANKALAAFSNGLSLRHTMTNITADMYAGSCGFCPLGGGLAGYFLIDTTTGYSPNFVKNNPIAWARPVLKTNGPVTGACTESGGRMICELANSVIVNFPSTGISACIACGCLVHVDTNGSSGPTRSSKSKPPTCIDPSGCPDVIQLFISGTKVLPANTRTKNILASGDPTKGDTSNIAFNNTTCESNAVPTPVSPGTPLPMSPQCDLSNGNFPSGHCDPSKNTDAMKCPVACTLCGGVTSVTGWGTINTARPDGMVEITAFCSGNNPKTALCDSEGNECFIPNP